MWLKLLALTSVGHAGRPRMSALSFERRLRFGAARPAPYPCRSGREQAMYDPVFNDALQWMWGDGFLAPGGPAEVAELLKPVSIAGAHVLDVGSGLGAIDVLLVNDHGAATVVGVDVEAHLIDASVERAANAGLAEQVTYRLIEAGPLPFADAGFDVVFTKDAIVHIPEKQPFYEEVLRVLAPGGLFVGSDWLRGGPETMTDVSRRWLDVVHLNFEMQDLDHTSEAIAAAGFTDVSLRDRNDWYQDLVVEEIASLSGDRYDGLVELIGEEQAAYRRESSLLKQQVIDIGFLRPTHFVARKAA
ncbi:MAG: class I SAM-dependent methyltransferase [Acidimicrobiales bacterium]